MYHSSHGSKPVKFSFLADAWNGRLEIRLRAAPPPGSVGRAPGRVMSTTLLAAVGAFAALLAVLLAWLSARGRRGACGGCGLERLGHVLLVTAHPDDECMFFAPTLLSLRRAREQRRREDQVFLLCLSEGMSQCAPIRVPAVVGQRSLE